MAGRSVQSGARALLFDRLSVATTEGSFEAKPLRYYSIEEVQNSVAKEVSDLLNTRRSASSFDADIAASTIAYGIGDYAGFSFKSARDLRYIAQDIEKAIKRFEPRLLNVAVEIPLEQQVNGEPVVKIDAKLCLDKVTHQFSFEIAIHAERHGE